MLRTRVLSAIVLLPLVLVFAYLGGVAWLIAVLIAGIQAWREMVQLLQRDHFTLDRNLGLFFVVGAIIEAYAYGSGLVAISLLRPLLAGLIIFSLIWALYYKGEHPTANWGVTVASALYLGFLLSHFVSIRERENGFSWVMFAFVLTWVTDASAYFIGSALGKHKLWPRISPKKTWEGLAGSCVLVLLVAPFLGQWWLGLAPWMGLVAGALVACFAPFGDLTVSLLKRMAHSKDSSQLIPGHGGMLDRLDSLLFVFPVITYFAIVVAGP